MIVERCGADVRIHPAGPVCATMCLPGSKSFTNRYLLCAALADGQTLLQGASLSMDSRRMVEGLRRLGIEVELEEAPARIRVRGCRGHLPATEADLDVQDAGTAMRFLTALAALGWGRYRLDGSPRMRQRPIGPLVDALRTLGAPIGYEAAEGYPPLVVHGRGLAGGSICMQGLLSSQFLSALLMVAPYAGSDIFISLNGPLPSQPYVAMTQAVMRNMGVEILQTQQQRFIVPAGQRYRGASHTIEPDASAAAYFWAAAAITGGRVRTAGLSRGSAQGDVHFADILAQMGCTVNCGPDYIEVAGPPAGRLTGIDVDLNAMPDTVPILAAVALLARGPTTIRNVAHLRVKETDRLSALAGELARLGATVQTRPDAITVLPPSHPTPTTIETYGDHRLAMSFSIAGLAIDGITVRNADCVAKSLPGFFELLDSLAGAGSRSQ
jgi:3-phosphoshikimate 1-carboxyvinyltransferase